MSPASKVSLYLLIGCRPTPTSATTPTLPCYKFFLKGTTHIELGDAELESTQGQRHRGKGETQRTDSSQELKRMSLLECCLSREKHLALPPVKVIDTQEVYEEVSMLERGVTRVMG